MVQRTNFIYASFWLHDKTEWKINFKGKSFEGSAWYDCSKSPKSDSEQYGKLLFWTAVPVAEDVLVYELRAQLQKQRRLENTHKDNMMSMMKWKVQCFSLSEAFYKTVCCLANELISKVFYWEVSIEYFIIFITVCIIVSITRVRRPKLKNLIL